MIRVTIDAEIGQTLLADLLERFVQPEVKRRLDTDELAVGTPIYRFQVLVPTDAQHAVRLNEEVGGSVDIEAVEGEEINSGDTVFSDQVAAVTRYEPRPEDADVPHVTAFAHKGGWTVAFDLGGGHATRHAFLERAREFLATTRDQAVAGRIHAFFENAFGACELLAKAELLSSRPTVDVVLGSSTHPAVARPYHAWAKLGNTEVRFARLLSRLTKLRSAARYPDRDLPADAPPLEETLATLVEMERHVTSVVERARHAELSTEMLIAKRPLHAGQLVTDNDVSIYPLKTPRRAPRG